MLAEEEDLTSRVRLKLQICATYVQACNVEYEKHVWVIEIVNLNKNRVSVSKWFDWLAN